MSKPIYNLPTLALAGAVILAVSACTQPTPPYAGYNANASPPTGSAQGVNPHNSEPMPSGMVMQNNGLAPAQQMSTDPNSVPRTGSVQGASPHNSAPMPSGMVMTPSRTAPLRSNPDGVPQTGSNQGVNTHNSEPMPSGMVMPPTRSGY